MCLRAMRTLSTVTRASRCARRASAWETHATGSNAACGRRTNGGLRPVSPLICVTTAYPTARVMVRNLTGGDPVGFSVGYAGTPTFTHPRGGGDK